MKCMAEVETRLNYLGTEIADLFQRYEHALDRIIALEEQIRQLESKEYDKWGRRDEM